MNLDILPLHLKPSYTISSRETSTCSLFVSRNIYRFDQVQFSNIGRRPKFPEQEGRIRLNEALSMMKLYAVQLSSSFRKKARKVFRMPRWREQRGSLAGSDWPPCCSITSRGRRSRCRCCCR